MTYQYEEISIHLRNKYFRNDYMNFGPESGYYVLSLNGRKYEIKLKTFQQYNDLQDYIEEGFKSRFPELFI